jgi:Flp pilus assembly protein TadG
MRTSTRGVSARWRERRQERSRGAVLVEFALVAPVLFLIVFGIIEFGWLFLQNIDVRHGAREGARLAAVNFKTTSSPTSAEQQDQIIAEMCSRMDADASVSVNLFRPVNDAAGGNVVGQEFEVRVHQDYDSLTGLLSAFVDDITLSSTVSMRIEQDATWASHPNATTFEACPP